MPTQWVKRPHKFLLRNLELGFAHERHIVTVSGLHTKTSRTYLIPLKPEMRNFFQRYLAVASSEWSCSLADACWRDQLVINTVMSHELTNCNLIWTLAFTNALYCALLYSVVTVSRKDRWDKDGGRKQDVNMSEYFWTWSLAFQ